jgi:hypothetical protein
MGLILSSYEVKRTSRYIRPGIDPLCGWPWLDLHEHDLDGWTPTIELDRPGSHFKFTIRDRQAMNQVSKVIRDR